MLIQADRADSLCALRRFTGLLLGCHSLTSRADLFCCDRGCAADWHAPPVIKRRLSLVNTASTFDRVRGGRTIRMPECMTLPLLNNLKVGRCPYLNPVAD